MMFTEEDSELICQDIKPAVDDLIATYGERLALASLFGYVSSEVLKKLGKDSYARLLEGGLLVLKKHIDVGGK